MFVLPHCTGGKTLKNQKKTKTQPTWQPYCTSVSTSFSHLALTPAGNAKRNLTDTFLKSSPSLMGWGWWRTCRHVEDLMSLLSQSPFSRYSTCTMSALVLLRPILRRCFVILRRLWLLFWYLVSEPWVQSHISIKPLKTLLYSGSTYSTSDCVLY